MIHMGSLFHFAGFIALGLVPVVGSPGEYAYDGEGGEELQRRDVGRVEQFYFHDEVPVYPVEVLIVGDEELVYHKQNGFLEIGVEGSIRNSGA